MCSGTNVDREPVAFGQGKVTHVDARRTVKGGQRTVHKLLATPLQVQLHAASKQQQRVQATVSVHISKLHGQDRIRKVAGDDLFGEGDQSAILVLEPRQAVRGRASDDNL